MPNFGYHFARAKGRVRRAVYAAALSATARRAINPPAELPFEVYAYSGESALPEQVASIRSFLRHAGRPLRFTVVSDGTYTSASIALLKSLDPCLAVARWDEFSIPEEMRSYVNGQPTGKQLALIMSLPRSAPALYIDSDVLFFPGAAGLAVSGAAAACYLPDCQLSADERLFRSAEEKAAPVNTGVLFLNRKLDWSLGMERFLALQGAPNFFTNQTVTHLVMHANGAQPLDPRRFVLQLDDQFIYRDNYARPEIVLRHYVNPVRHKFWTA